MLKALALVALSLPAQFGDQLDREAAAPGAAYWAEPYCEESEGLSPGESSFSTGVGAAPGGAWWLDRTSPATAALLADPGLVELVAGDGSVVAVEMHATLLTLAVRVPDGATHGASYVLRRTTGGGGLVLRVEGEPARPAAFELGHLALGAPVPASCQAECYEPGFAIPGKVSVELGYAGDPVVIDVWLKIDGTSPHPLDERRLDSVLVSPDGLDTGLLASGDLWGPLDPQVHVEIRDPNTLDLLHEAVLTYEAGFPSLEFEQNDLPLCSEIYGDGDCCYDPGPCGAYGTEVPLGLLGVLGGLGLVRRRRARTRR